MRLNAVLYDLLNLLPFDPALGARSGRDFVREMNANKSLSGSVATFEAQHRPYF